MSFPANPRSTNQPGAAPNLPAVDLSSLAYPGATPGQGENQVAIAGGAVKMQTLFTSDSVDTVLAFYKNKLGDAATISQSGQQALVQSTGPNGIFNIAFSPDSASGKTKIVITSIGK